MTTIACCRCTATFPTFAKGQAHGCAAHIDTDGVYGGYGSEIADLTRLVFTDPALKAALPQGGALCDGCLQALLDAGALVEEEIDHTALIAEAQAKINARFDLGNGKWVLIDGPD